jgi:uncharacterized membrane protein YgcG
VMTKQANGCLSRVRIMLISGLAVVASSVILPSAATAADEIGLATTITNNVTGAIGNSRRQLSTGNPVFLGERLAAAPRSFGEFRLKDDTKLALGPGANLVLSNVIYKKGQGGARRVWLNLYKGSLRFATGFSAKRAYRLNAATASIGVRGTLFDVFTARGFTIVLLLHGHMRVCGERGAGQCRNLRHPCDWIAVDPAGRLRKPRGQKAHEAIGVPSVQAFPFLRAEILLDPDLRGNSLRCLSVAGPPPNTPQPFWSVPGDPSRPGFGFTDPASANTPESEGSSSSSGSSGGGGGSGSAGGGEGEGEGEGSSY